MVENLSADEVAAKYRSLLPDGAGDIFVSLYNATTALNINWRFYQELFSTSENSVALLNLSAGAVFQSYQRALRIDVFLAVCRMTDPVQSAGKDNASIAQLVAAVGPELPESDAAALSQEAESLRKKANPIRIHRNKVLAHHDLGHVMLTANPLPGVTGELVTEVITEISNSVNRVGAFFEAGNICFAESIEGSGSPTALLNRLEIAHEMRGEYFAKKRRAT